MNESTSKRLADFIGLCWHEWEDGSGFCVNCKTSRDHYPRGDKERRSNKDFTSPNGWQLIADEIKKRGEWDLFYDWHWSAAIKDKYCTRSMATLRYFHELKPAEKSAIVAEWREEVGK